MMSMMLALSVDAARSSLAASRLCRQATLPITRYLTPHLNQWDIGLGRSLRAAAVIIFSLLVT